jgi:phosphoglycolate phosphatase
VAQGKQLVFVTNNSTKSRKGYLGKFTGLGLNVAAEEIYSSSYAAAAYLESINFPKDKKVSLPFCSCHGFDLGCHDPQPQA